MEKPAKILIIDDEHRLLDVITSYLEKEEYHVITSDNGREGLDLFFKESPSLLIVDLMLPDIRGEEICKRVREVSNIPIIMLTAKSEEEDIVKGLEKGADDYITKPFSPKELVARVKVAIRRYSNSFGEILSFNQKTLVLDMQEKTVKLKGEYANLTQVEFKILAAIATMPNKVFSREELLNISTGNDYGAYDRVIDAHIKNIRSKIEEDSKNPVFIQTVFGAGYRFGGKRDD